MNKLSTRGTPRRTILVMAIGLGLGVASMAALAQSNASGAIFGDAPAGTGASVHIVNKDTGFTRDIPVDQSGRYRASSLPTGRYSVTLQKDGQVVSSRDNVSVTIAGGSEVSFASAANAKELGSLTVTANALPAIDVSSVDSRTVITAEQLQKLPIARNVNSAALLAPGVVAGATDIVGNNGQGNLLSFGGGAQSENVYNINGYNVTNPLDNLGFMELPFSAIDQEQVLTGGYGVEFGRSTGGVVNITTKRGSNTWQGSVNYFWTPAGLRDGGRSRYYPANRAGSQYAGRMQQYNGRDLTNEDSISLSVGGPLIKDRLFIFGAADFTRTNDQNYTLNNPFLGSLSAGSGFDKRGANAPRWMGKIDWNITDNNILEFTGVGNTQTRHEADYGVVSTNDGKNINWDASDVGATNYDKTSSKLYLAKYTGYLTDNLTLTASYGKTKADYVNLPGGADPTCQGVLDRRTNNVTPATPITQACTAASIGSIITKPFSSNDTNGWRADLEYRLGDHDIRGGVDNQTLNSQYGDAYWGGAVYVYSSTTSPGKELNPKFGVGAPNALNYGRKIIYATGGSLKTEQNAQYLEDHWQITDRWLGYVGLRNEQFSNYNNTGGKYISQRHQLAPRLGASWDVYGDSTFKVYANAGRYHLGVPNSVALRGAGGSLYTTQYFNYTGVDANGYPTGMTPIGPAYSANGEFGQARDPNNTHTKNLKPYYQDEYILGFDKQLNAEWSYGVKATYRNLKSLIDDMSDSRSICQAAVNQGLAFAADPTDPTLSQYELCTGSYAFSGLAFNPGSGIDFTDDVNGDGVTDRIKVSAKDLGFPKAKRKYLALNFHLTHPFDGKWYGNVEYVWARSFGNTEGQINSDLDQANVGQTETWDFPEFMVGSSGELPNSRRHQIKAQGYMQLTPEFLVGANVDIASGRPKSCISAYYFDNTDPAGYGANSVYFTCDNKLTPRSQAGHLPWTYLLSLSASYRPAFADNKLAFNVDVFNVLDSQTGTAINEVKHTNDPAAVDAVYGAYFRYQTPRYVRLSVGYDFSL